MRGCSGTCATSTSGSAGCTNMTDKRDLQLLEPDVVRGLAARLQMTALLSRFPERPVWAVFMFVNGFVSIGLMALAAMVSHTPFVFPSLGPTAFLFFFTPTSPTAS